MRRPFSMRPTFFVRRASRRLFGRANVLALMLAMVGAISATEVAASDNIDLAAEFRAIRGDYHVVVDLNRSIIISELLKRWPNELAAAYGTSADTLPSIAERLQRATADQLYRLGLANSSAEVERALGARIDEPIPVSKVLGSATSDLSYTPITPCRIVDTRNGAGGKLNGGETRNWLASNPGGTFSAQGGSPTNCGIPIIPSAVAVNITVANTGPGPAFLSVWPFGQSRPTVSTLNWVSSNSQLANSALLPMCIGSCSADFSVFASSATDVIIDAVGYFSAPFVSGVSSHVLTAQTLLLSGFSNTIGTIGGCLPNEYTISGSCKASSFLVFLSGSYLNATAGWSCDYTNNSLLTQLISVQSLCISPPAASSQ